MLIKRLTIEDFGLFRGRNELDLAPRTRYRERRPIILIGGKNGSGRTTVLDAMRLALYGPMALGPRVGVREYEAYLADRIHRADDTLFQANSAAVGIEYEYAQAGVVSTYAVERRWERADRGVRVRLAITQDGAPLDELDREHADEFLRQMIPPGVSQLFFFDGEKIQELADGELDHVALADAVRWLIGLDHVERLRADLRVYAGKLQDLPAAGPLNDELARIAREQDDLDARRLELARAADQAESHLDRTRQEVAREEQRLTEAGGAFAGRRDGLAGRARPTAGSGRRGRRRGPRVVRRPAGPAPGRARGDPLAGHRGRPPRPARRRPGAGVRRGRHRRGGAGGRAAGALAAGRGGPRRAARSAGRRRGRARPPPGDRRRPQPATRDDRASARRTPGPGRRGPLAPGAGGARRSRGR